MSKDAFSKKYRLLKFRLMQLPMDLPSLQIELDEIHAACMRLLSKWEKQPLIFGIAPCGDWHSEIFTANERRQFFQAFVDKWIPLEKRLNKVSAEISLAQERVKLDPDWIKVYVMNEKVKEGERAEEEAYLLEKLEGRLESNFDERLKRERSTAARKAADALHKPTNEQKAAALAEWEKNGNSYSSMSAFARRRHEAYEVTERTLYGWIRDSRKNKT